MKRPRPAPTVAEKSAVNILKENSHFTGPINFTNVLPPVPIDPKALLFFDSRHFVPSVADIEGLRLEQPTFLLHEKTLGASFDLVDTAVYLPSKDDVELAPEDEELMHMNPKMTGGITKKVQKSAVQLQMRSTHRADASTKAPKVRTLESSLEEVADKIEASFGKPKELVHRTKPHLKPVRVLALFPETELWEAAVEGVTFDSNPLPASIPIPEATPMVIPPILQNTFIDPPEGSRHEALLCVPSDARLGSHSTSRKNSHVAYRPYQSESRSEPEGVEYVIVLSDSEAKYFPLRSQHKLKHASAEVITKLKENPKVFRIQSE